MTYTNVFPRAKHKNHANVSRGSAPPRYHSPKPQEASADESFVDRCRGTINILELLAVSLGITRWEENSPLSAEVAQAARTFAGCSEFLQRDETDLMYVTRAGACTLRTPAASSPTQRS